MDRRRYLVGVATFLSAGCFGGRRVTSTPTRTEVGSTSTPTRTEVDGTVRDIEGAVTVQTHRFAWNDPDTIPAAWIVGTIHNDATSTVSVQVSVNVLDESDTVFYENYTVVTDIRSDQRSEFDAPLYLDRPHRADEYELTIEAWSNNERTPTPTTTPDNSLVVTKGATPESDEPFDLQAFIYNAEHADINFPPDITRVTLESREILVRYEGEVLLRSNLGQLAAILDSYIAYFQAHDNVGRLVVTRVDPFGDPIEHVYCKPEWAETFLSDDSVTGGDLALKVFETLEDV